MAKLEKEQTEPVSPRATNLPAELGASSGFDALPEFVQPSCYSFINPKTDKEVAASGAPFGSASSKVGQTMRPIPVRLREWGETEHYDQIEYIASLSLKLDITDSNGNNIYTDDHSFHKALANDGFIKTIKLFEENGYSPEVQWSREFYTDMTGAGRVVDETILRKLKANITADYTLRKHGYRYLTPSKDGKNFAVKRQSFQITDYFSPRKYQSKAVDSLFWGFMSKPLGNQQLLYSPTRSGKSVMAAWYMEKLAYSPDSPLYEKTMNPHDGNVFVVVSGKVDVKSEWQETFQAHNDFAKKNPLTGKQKFAYIDADDMKDHHTLGKNVFDEKFKTADNVVVFLSLQDLAGSTNHESKPHHAQLIGRVSYVVGDECHFGMFGDSKQYSRALKVADNGLSDSEVDRAEEGFKQLNPEHGSLYISATPFSILVNGGIEGFALSPKGDARKGNVVVVSPEEIKSEADKWIAENPDKPEWKSEYFGIVEQHYFAVNVGDINDTMSPKQEVVKEINPDTKRMVPVLSANGNLVMRDIPELQNEELAEKIFTKLFLQIAESTEGNNQSDIDDSLDSVPNFFVNESFLKTGAGNHILIVVPRRASADAVERILDNLGIAAPYDPSALNAHSEDSESNARYTSLNLTSTDSSHPLAGKPISETKQIISELAEDKKPTISITVNKATTGVSVKQWDTTLMMAKSDSMEKTTQIMGRQNTPNVATLTGEDEDGNEVKTRHALKQHTAFISFDPSHLFETVERLDRFYEQADGEDPDRPGRKTFSSGRIWDCTSAGLREVYVNDVREALYKHLADNGVGSLARSLPFDLSKIDGLNAAERKYLSDRGLKAQGNNFNMTLFDALEDEEEDGQSKGSDTSFTCAECQINNAVFGQDNENDYSDISLCEICNVERSNKQAYEDAVSSGSTEFNAVNADGESVSVDTADAAAAVSGSADKGDDLFAGAFSGVKDGEDTDKTASEKALVKEAKRLAKEKKKQDEEIRDNLRGIQTTMLIYVAVSRWGKGGEGEWTIREIQENLKINKSAQSTAERIGLRKEDLRYLLKFADTGVINSQIFTVRNHLSNKSLSKWERLRFVIKDLPSVSANEVFTPDHVAELLIDVLGFKDEDFMEVLSKKGSKPDEGGFLDIGSKEAALLVEINKRSLEAIENSVKSGDITPKRASKLRKRLRDEKLVCLPSSSMTYEIAHKVYRDHGWNTHNILYVETGANIANWALGIVNLHENFAKMKEAEKAVETGENKRSVNNAIKDIKKLNQERERLMTELGAPGAKKNRAVRESIERIVSRMDKGFDAVVGNPPYQNLKGDSIYQYFALSAASVSRHISMIHKANFLTESNRGGGMKLLSSLLAENNGTPEIYYWDNPSDVFDGTSLTGGVLAYSVDQGQEHEKTKFNIYNSVDKVFSSNSRPLVDSDGTISVVMDGKDVSKLQKVRGRYDQYMDSWVSSSKPHGFRRLTEEQLMSNKGEYLAYSFQGKGRLGEDDISKNKESAMNYKVCISYADGAATLRREFIGEPRLSKPKEVLSETYQIIGKNHNDEIAGHESTEEPEAIIKYIKTRNLRDLLRMTGYTIRTTSKTFKHVPLMDFSTTAFDPETGTVDWSQSIEDIEKQLVEIWGWTKEEWEHTKENVMPMRSDKIKYISEK